MARPSVADARREQIIEATLATMAQHGISGTTLDRIADAAGMSRGHVRHFVGNRDRLLLDAARAFYVAPAVIPPEIDALEPALDYLFGEEFASSSADNVIVLAFVELARSSEDIAAVLAEAYGSARERLLAFIAAAHPRASAAAHEIAAQGVLTTALGNVFIGDFDREPQRTERSRQAVDALLSAL
ncbi:TetR/AcrR family transcriptional regulator [Leucobacter chromiiresistens]|uniref:DNA-binding transcriptional regulator, AcrR family n=1 Tax=Leucobacter chromiiresistens TaxID=1079994 RepID=A0A1H0ZHX8_9MICO|nr:TetR/AcrR family transcriptional regulator [Leucobacter chromiiresistens]SDQ27075.1 DNA-binding transcriptional regulator, AcrR family [Leucobacter chromiiresistens]